jgi:hypothetical protein
MLLNHYGLDCYSGLEPASSVANSGDTSTAIPNSEFAKRTAPHAGSHFTRFISAKVQILTPACAAPSTHALTTRVYLLYQYKSQFTWFASTTVQILTPACAAPTTRALVARATRSVTFSANTTGGQALLYMCPRTATYVSSYYYICALILPPFCQYYLQFAAPF